MTSRSLLWGVRFGRGRRGQAEVGQDTVPCKRAGGPSVPSATGRTGLRRAILGGSALLAAVTLLLGLLRWPALANAADDSMTFTPWRNPVSGPGDYRWGQGGRDYIFASGEITSETPRRLQAALDSTHAHPGTILVLNSPGGGLEPALEMGRIIRGAKLWTEVGSAAPLALGLYPNLDPAYFPYAKVPTAPPFPGFCYSSCTFAFLGGVVRTVGMDSAYGVHRFYGGSGSFEQAQQLTQITMAQIVAYLKKMDVDSAFVDEMVKKGSESVTFLTEKRMADLRVITPLWETKWQLEQGPAAVYFDGSNTAAGRTGQGEEMLYCVSPAPSSNGQVVRMDIYAAAPQGVDAGTFARGVTAYVLRLDGIGEIYSMGAKEVVRPAFVSSRTGRIGMTLGLSLSRFEDILAKTHYLGVALFNPGSSSNSGVNFVGTTMTLDRDLDALDRFARYCLKPTDASFTLVNRSNNQALVKLLYRRHGAPEFSGNQLVTGFTRYEQLTPLAPQQSTKVSMPQHSGCAFDLMAEFADRTQIGWENLDLCFMNSVLAHYPPKGPPAPDASTEVRNVGKVAISVVQISPHSESSWGPNLLPVNNPILAGARASFKLAQYKTCQLDISVQYANGSQEARTNIDLCTLSLNFEAAPPPP